MLWTDSFALDGLVIIHHSLMNHAGGKEDEVILLWQKTITSSKIIITAHLSEPTYTL